MGQQSKVISFWSNITGVDIAATDDTPQAQMPQLPGLGGNNAFGGKSLKEK